MHIDVANAAILDKSLPGALISNWYDRTNTVMSVKFVCSKRTSNDICRRAFYTWGEGKLFWFGAEDKPVHKAIHYTFPVDIIQDDSNIHSWLNLCKADEDRYLCKLQSGIAVDKAFNELNRYSTVTTYATTSFYEWQKIFYKLDTIENKELRMLGYLLLDKACALAPGLFNRIYEDIEEQAEKALSLYYDYLLCERTLS